MSKIFRTPDSRFENLPDFGFAPNYLTLEGEIRLHYLDEGAKDAPPVLMMHGEPTWSYLYRHMIGPVVSAGYRVLAPDLVGFGKSDKPVDPAIFSYAGHVEWMTQWVKALDLKGVVLACQDWGSLIGLRLVAAMPDRFAGVALSNGGLPAGGEPTPAFEAWCEYASKNPDMHVGSVVQGGSIRTLSEAEISAYDAPFPNSESKAASSVFPSLVPVGDNVAVPDQLAAWDALKQFDRPFTCAFSDKDPITSGWSKPFRDSVPGTQHDLHRTLSGGHFIQEDDPEGFVTAILDTAKMAGT